MLGFCKCADKRWQKSGWKKNKFWVEKEFVFIRNFLIALHITGKVLAKNGLPCRQFQRKTEPEQKFFPLTKIQKIS